MQDLSWMKNPTVVVLLAVLAVFAIDQLVWNGDKYANLAGVAETPTCLAYSSGKLIPAGNLEMDPDRARSYSKTDVRTHDRQKLLNILDQCSADSCPAELQPDLQQMAWRYFYNRGEATIEEYKRFGEPGLEILSWRFGTIDDNQIVSKLTTLHAAGQFKIWDWSHTTRSTAQILMSGPNVELEPCRAPADERDPFTLRSDELVSRSAPRL